uniref:GDSL esterase/lipase At5g55050 n=1 Tax=Anthurium amnicola TaxID=1678845 RepID=A0A1D1Y983_9ARAE
MAEGSSQLLTALVVVVLASVMAKPVLMSSEGRSAPAVFVFGDSLFDVGNNNFLPLSIAKADFPHNGVDFPGGTPTGRFSNGYNIADCLAKSYGFNASPSAFLSLTEAQLEKSIHEGINFASAGSGILEITGSQLGEVISMDAQIQYFNTSLQSFTAGRHSSARRAPLSKSIFLISAGSNDLFGFYQSNASPSNLTTSEFITLMTSKHREQLRTLYSLGARRFGIMGLGLIGCCPSQRILTASGGCVAELNDYALQFHLALKKVLGKLSSMHKGMKYSLGEGHTMATMITSQPLTYGFKEVTNACCGCGRLDGQFACTPIATLCTDRESHYFWDWFHPTETAAKLFAKMLYGGTPELASPINFRELAED